MKERLKLFLGIWFVIPHLFVYLFLDKSYINVDIDRWLVCAGTFLKDKVSDKPTNKITFVRLIGLALLLITMPEFRNVFYLRCGYLKYFLLWLKPNPTLFIRTKSSDFGPGVYIQHGYSTGINADHIGRNCWINQMVSIGYNGSRKYGYGRPWIGDNVRVSCGARVFGKVRVGEGSVIGVNAVVVKDVLPNSTVIPSPMMLIRKEGKDTYEKL